VVPVFRVGLLALKQMGRAWRGSFPCLALSFKLADGVAFYVARFLTVKKLKFKKLTY
jgi:hypothetical protein